MGGANPPRRAPCSVFLHESGRYPRTGYRSTTGRSHGPPQPAEVRPRWANCGRRTKRHARQPCRTASRSRPGYRAAAARPVRGPALPGPKPERRCRSSRGDFLVSAEDRAGVASLVTTCFGPRTAAARFTGRTCDELGRRRRRRDRGARAVWLDQPPHGRSAPAPSRSPRSAPVQRQLLLPLDDNHFCRLRSSWGPRISLDRSTPRHAACSGFEGRLAVRLPRAAQSLPIRRSAASRERRGRPGRPVQAGPLGP